jgi:tetratricopeptide (TPR) repeat protein
MECLVLTQKIRHNDGLPEVVTNNMPEADVSYIRALILFVEGFVMETVPHLDLALERDSTHVQTRLLQQRVTFLQKLKADGNKAFEAKQYDEAHSLYTSALQKGPQNGQFMANMLLNRGKSCLKLNNKYGALEDFSRAAAIDSSTFRGKAYYHRAELYMDLKMYDEAISDIEAILAIEQSDWCQTFLAHALTKKRGHSEAKVCPWSVLGLKPFSSQKQVKEAFYSMARKYHPDKHTEACSQIQRVMDHKFKEVNRAYERITHSRTQQQL